MPEVVPCPECDRKVRVPEESLGKKVKCPGCGTAFLARAAQDDEDEDEDRRPARAGTRSRRDEDEEDEDEDRPRSRRSRDEDEDEDENDRPRKKKKSRSSSVSAYGLTSLGMLLLIIATGLLVLILLAYQGGYFIARQAQSTTMLTATAWTVRILGILFVMVAAAGHGLNLTVPSKSGDSVKLLAIATFAAALMVAIGVGLGLIVFPGTFLLGLERSGGPPTIELPMGLGGITSTDFWGMLHLILVGFRDVGTQFTFALGCFFLYSLSQRLDRPDLGRHVILFLLAQMALLEAYPYIPRFITQLLLMSTTRGNMGSMASVLDWTTWIFMAIRWTLQAGLAVWYVLILLQMRTALASAGRRG